MRIDALYWMCRALGVLCIVDFDTDRSLLGTEARRNLTVLLVDPNLPKSQEQRAHSLARLQWHLLHSCEVQAVWL